VAFAFPGFGDDVLNVEGNDGVVFTPNVDIWVTELGYLDSSQDGFVNGTHAVGIFEESTQSLLASVSVTSSSPLTASFRYVALPGPLQLSSGTTYVVVGHTGDNEDAWYIALPDEMTIAPEIAYSHYTWNYDPDLTFPDDLDEFTAYWGGPNFQYTVVPEPSTAVLLGCGLMVLAAFLRGRRH
jgi:hypothetical protein